MPLFMHCHTVIKQLWLTEMIEETFTSSADFSGVDTFFKRSKSAFFHHALEWTALREGVGVVGNPSLRYLHAVDAVPLIIGNIRDGTVNRNFMEIRSTQTGKLGICI